MYMFSRVHPFVDDPKLFDHPQSIGAYHTSDVPYWFETQDALNLFRTTRNWTPYDRELADKMSDCLVAFARTGDPATEAVAWPAWTDGSEQYVEFGDAIAVRAENVDRMQFQSKAGVTSTTPSASHD
jgi:para-nitrobenzyl esterase